MHRGSDLSQRYESIRQRIEEAATACGRDFSDVALIAVSKGQCAKEVRDLYRLGHRDFGENYLDELSAKAAALSDLKELRWHFIGALQSNKIQRLVQLCTSIQSLQSLKHMRYAARYAKELGKTPFPVFIEVNAGGEAQKSGIDPRDVASLAAVAREQYRDVLTVMGIMAVPPAAASCDSKKGVPSLFEELGRLASGIGAGKLSLGMSSDFEAAIAAGSHCVRIGTALFGERTEPKSP